MSNVFDFELQSLVAKLPGPSARCKDSGSVFGPIGGVGRKRSWVYTLLCLLFLVPLTNAQIRSDTITGLATDPNGALIVGADVIVSNTGTHATSSTRTTDTERYTVPYPETGTYHVVNTVRLTTSQSRIDFRYRSHSIYGSGGVDLGEIVQPFGWGTSPFNNYGNHTADDNYYGQIGATVVVSPSLFVDLRYGITRIVATNFGGMPSGDGMDWSRESARIVRSARSETPPTTRGR